MKKSKFTEAQIVFALKQAETGIKVNEIYRQLGVSQATFFNWKKKPGGLGVSELRTLRQLEDENAQLKRLVADLSLDKHMLQKFSRKSLKGVDAAAVQQICLIENCKPERIQCDNGSEFISKEMDK